ncbi:SAM hydrolase/SAM-dependent halogenase family protein [Thiohalorhabdus sp.]|uniref:SAM hydrolase/SAM-dependent halogenase family protein n=1 Tax=Thiohalorhabdus sp. TaxID=3094134 RepID=UPI002FC34688
MSQPVIALYTDFGNTDPYVGQMHAALLTKALGTSVVDLHHYAPAFAPGPAGLLLEALLPFLPEQAVVVSVVDPGVGTDRGTLALWSRGHWLVGPDNGLFGPLLDEPDAVAYRLNVKGHEAASATFHGRDVFAPAAAELARGHRMVLGESVPHPVRLASRRDQIIYCDHYGNLMTGLQIPADTGYWLRVRDRDLSYARTFGDVAPGEPFWYGNSLGLVEVAVREDSARYALDAGEGTSVAWSPAQAQHPK